MLRLCDQSLQNLVWCQKDTKSQQTADSAAGPGRVEAARGSRAHYSGMRPRRQWEFQGPGQGDDGNTGTFT